MPRRSKDDPDDLGGKGVYREDSYVRPRKEDNRPPRNDTAPDIPAGKPTRSGGLFGGLIRKNRNKPTE